MASEAKQPSSVPGLPRRYAPRNDGGTSRLGVNQVNLGDARRGWSSSLGRPQCPASHRVDSEPASLPEQSNAVALPAARQLGWVGRQLSRPSIARSDDHERPVALFMARDAEADDFRLFHMSRCPRLAGREDHEPGRHRRQAAEDEDRPNLGAQAHRPEGEADRNALRPARRAPRPPPAAARERRGPGGNCLARR